MKNILVILSIFGFSIAQGQIVTSSEIPKEKHSETDLSSKTIEQYGGNAFYEPFYGTLKVIPQKNGTSKIIDESKSSRFNSDFKDKYFVGFRIHKNPIEHPSVKNKYDYYPGILGCRYSQVIEVVDANTVVVNFQYNGGNDKEPAVSLHASGEFFFDNKSSISKAIEDVNRPEVIVFKSGKTYLSIGSWNAKVDLKNKPLILKSSNKSQRSNIKISAEDAFIVNTGGSKVNEKDINKLFITGGALIVLNDGDNDCIFRDVNILATTYMAKRVQYGYDYSIFKYNGGQCERIVGIENCNTQVEKENLEHNAITLPEGANWVAPDFGYFAGGGKHDENDITGYQIIRQYNSVIHSATPYSIKNNNGAGNFQEIIGESEENRSEVVEIVEGLKLGVDGTGKYNGKNGEVLKAKVSFHDDKSTYNDILKKEKVSYGPRLVQIHDDKMSWYMLSNQYWTGGTSRGMTEPITVLIDGFEFRFGNNGDWRPVMGYKNPNNDNWSIKNSQEARMFNKIPKVGEECSFKILKVKVKKNAKVKVDPKKVAYTWDIACQVGDEYKFKGEVYTVKNVKRRGGNGHALKGWNPSKTGLLFGYGKKPKEGIYNVFMHLNEVHFDKQLPSNLDEFSMECKVSKAEYLLDGKQREASLVYDRDYNGHCMYNRMYVNQYFKNVYFKGYFRTTGDMHEGTFKDLWNFPRVRYYENVEHREGGQHLAKCVKFRYDIEKNEKYKNTFIVGGTMTLDNSKAPLEFVYSKQPSGIGYSKLVDPIVSDKLGFNQVDNFPWGNMMIKLTKGQDFYISNAQHNSSLTLIGTGKFILENVEILSGRKQNARLVVIANEDQLEIDGQNVRMDEFKVKTSKNVNTTNAKVKLVNSEVKKVNISKKLNSADICNKFIVNGKCVNEYGKSKKGKSKK